jgi:Coenzyme PQQ synthesis protein D (PqqD)
VSTFSRKPSVIFDVVDGKMTLCNLDDGDFFELNDTAAKIWLACVGHCTADQLTSAIAGTYRGEDSSRLASDVGSFIDMLCEAGLLSVVAETTPHTQIRNHACP